MGSMVPGCFLTAALASVHHEATGDRPATAAPRKLPQISRMLSLVVFLSHVPLSPSLPSPSSGIGRPDAPACVSGLRVEDYQLRRDGRRRLRDDDQTVPGADVSRCGSSSGHSMTSRAAGKSTFPGASPPRQQSPRLRGGNDEGGGDTFAQDVEGGNVESALADPDMTKVRAFMPRELRRGLSEGFGSSSFSLKSLLISKCWFYPLPPWGRKDVFNCESGFLQFWHLVMCMCVSE